MRFDVKFNLSNERIPIVFDKFHEVGVKEEFEYYEGEYEVTPSVRAKRLKTAEKMMRSDLTVTAIPYAEVTNTANGLTVTIAE